MANFRNPCRALQGRGALSRILKRNINTLGCGLRNLREKSSKGSDSFKVFKTLKNDVYKDVNEDANEDLLAGVIQSSLHFRRI